MSPGVRTGTSLINHSSVAGQRDKWTVSKTALLTMEEWEEWSGVRPGQTGELGREQHKAGQQRHCRVLERNNPRHQKQLCGEGPGDPGGQQAVHEPAGPLWHSVRSWGVLGGAFPAIREVILILCSALVSSEGLSPVLDSTVQERQDKHLLKRVQWRTTKTIRGLQHN
ncbi:hypothetical protein TURU_068059 [Turdus rufiventris]|nr:hypothetical protein TURU_068059 [Turdus rufiventris]